MNVWERYLRDYKTNARIPLNIISRPKRANNLKECVKYVTMCICIKQDSVADKEAFPPKSFQIDKSS
jgi:hypothetical protein